MGLSEGLLNQWTSLLWLPCILAKYISNFLICYVKVLISLDAMWKSLSCVWLFASPWTIACRAPLSMEFSRQEYWCGMPFPSPIIQFCLRIKCLGSGLLCGHLLGPGWWDIAVEGICCPTLLHPWKCYIQLFLQCFPLAISIAHWLWEECRREEVETLEDWGTHHSWVTFSWGLYFLVSSKHGSSVSTTSGSTAPFKSGKTVLFASLGRWDESSAL